MCKWSVARAKRGHAPIRSCLGHETIFEHWQQTGANQRRFAATARANYGNKAVRFKLAEQLINVLFASEKEVGFFTLKWSQAWKRTEDISCTMSTRHRSPRRTSTMLYIFHVACFEVYY